MKFPLYANGIPNTTVLCFNVDSVTADLDIRGVDPTRANTVYFDQRIDRSAIIALNGCIEMNIPLPPDKFMMVEITDAEKNTTTAKLKSISTIPLRTKTIYLTPEDEEYVNCAEWFACHSGEIAIGKAPSRGKIEFHVFWQMTDYYPNGQPYLSETPARVDHETGIVEVAKKFFDNYTIPMRVFILMHERVHFSKDTVSEEECDKNALNICLCLGYPKLELVQAATKIFPETPETKKRVDAMVRFINNW